MVERLPATDFRAARMMLEDDDYALPGTPTSPTDQISSETWHEIMDLPDDIAVAISDHHGSEFEYLNALWGEWLESMDSGKDGLGEAMLDASDCFQSSTFDFLHGYYRSAISGLRSAPELTAVGVLGNLVPDNVVYLKWKGGLADLAFPACRRTLQRRLRNNYAGLLEHDGWALAAYYQMCGYTHSRPKSSDGDLWQSNGPVYNATAISQVTDFQLSTYACCYLLIRIGRPQFRLGKESRALFETVEFSRSVDARRSYAELYALTNEGTEP